MSERLLSGADLRVFQRQLLREFVEEQDWKGALVLDYGCGDAPYRETVGDRGGHWIGYNRRAFPGALAGDRGPDNPLSQGWDVILCTQMLQYVPAPDDLLRDFLGALKPKGRLVLTYATNWPEVEPQDLWRFTKTGMGTLLVQLGYVVGVHRALGGVAFGDAEQLAFGYGLVAHATA